MEWYGVKGIFRWSLKASDETDRYEERVVLFRAASFEQALEKAEAEAAEYVEEDPASSVRIESLGLFNAYSIGEDSLSEGVEVFSGTYKSILGASEYVARYEAESGVRS